MAERGDEDDAAQHDKAERDVGDTITRHSGQSSKFCFQIGRLGRMSRAAESEIDPC